MEIRGVRVKNINQIKRGSGFFSLRPPEYFSVPLIASEGDKPQRAVNVGEQVKEGSVIAKPNGRYGSYVYSPCSGKVVGVVNKLNANGIECEHVIIVRDLDEEKELLKPLDSFEYDQENLLKRLYESGMVDNFAPYDPAYKKYLLKSPIKELIINCTDDDPYQSAESTLLETFPAEVLEGARLLMQVARAEKLVFIFTDKTRHAQNIMKQQVKKLAVKTIKIKTYPSVYPLHDSRLLAYYETGKMVPEGARTAQANVIVENVSNCYDFFNAVKKGEPCTQRAITVAGNNTLRKANYFIKNGTTIKHILSVVGTKNDNENMLVYGGIMSGIAQESLEISVGLSSSIILLCNSEEYINDRENPCISCGRCLQSCPVRLNVKKIDEKVVERQFNDAKRLGVEACIGCGVCSYVCPAKRYLAQRMSFAKDMAQGKVGKNPSSSGYILVDGVDLANQGVNLETDSEKLDQVAEAPLPEIDEMLNILSKKTEEETKIQETIDNKTGQTGGQGV